LRAAYAYDAAIAGTAQGYTVEALWEHSVFGEVPTRRQVYWLMRFLLDWMHQNGSCFEFGLGENLSLYHYMRPDATLDEDVEVLKSFKFVFAVVQYISYSKSDWDDKWTPHARIRHYRAELVLCLLLLAWLEPQIHDNYLRFAWAFCWLNTVSLLLSSSATYKGHWTKEEEEEILAALEDRFHWTARAFDRYMPHFVRSAVFVRLLKSGGGVQVARPYQRNRLTRSVAGMRHQVSCSFCFARQWLVVQIYVDRVHRKGPSCFLCEVGESLNPPSKRAIAEHSCGVMDMERASLTLRLSQVRFFLVCR